MAQGRPKNMKSPHEIRVPISVGIACCLAQIAFGQAANVAADSRLKAPISIRMKIEQLPAALKRLSKQTGVKLENVQTINDLKITAFVRDLPAGVVLAKIASVLGCEWKADGDLLRLVVNPEERIKRDRYIDAEDSAARRNVESQLNTIAQISSLNLATIRDEIRDQLAAQNGTSQTATYDPQRLALLQSALNPQNVTLSQMLSSMDATRVSSFWSGTPVAELAPPTSSAAPSGTYASNAGAGYSGPVALTNQRSRRSRTAMSGAPTFLLYDPFLYQVQAASQGGVRNVTKRPPVLITDYVPSGKLASMPFGKEVLAWDQPVPTDGDWAQITVQATDAKSAGGGRRLAVSDYLEVAFNQTNTSFISDGFRVPTATRDLNRGDGPLSSWISTLKKDNHLFTRFEDGVVMIRHGGFWRLRKFETPEENLAPLEAKAAKGKLTLSDYAGFVSKLTPEQAKPFSIQNSTVTVFDTRPLEVAMPAIQFYASLDNDSVRRASAGGIAYDQLSIGQKQLFVQAAVDGVFNGAASPSFDMTLARLSRIGEARGLGFLMRRESIPSGPSSIDGQAMLFGVNVSEATTYRVPVSD